METKSWFEDLVVLVLNTLTIDDLTQSVDNRTGDSVDRARTSVGSGSR